jgi:hypothetical protein
MSKFVLTILLLGACASLERSGSDRDPAPDAAQTPDAGVKHPTDHVHDASVPDSCPTNPPPECECDDDCGNGSKCDDGRCYRRCSCDDDCSGPDNMSCDHGLCKGHD